MKYGLGRQGIAAFAILLAVGAAACSEDKKGLPGIDIDDIELPDIEDILDDLPDVNPEDRDPDIDGGVGDEDDVIGPGDVDEDTTGDPDESDVPIDGPDNPTTCNPACTAGNFCDNGTCRPFECKTCTSNADCGAGSSCTDWNFGTQRARVCLASCSSANRTCPTGYSCNVASGICRPSGTCNITAPPAVKRDKACQAPADCPEPGMQCFKFPNLTNPPGGQCLVSCASGANACNSLETCLQFTRSCHTSCTPPQQGQPNPCADDETICLWVDQARTQGACLHWSAIMPSGRAEPGETCDNNSQDQNLSCVEGSICLGGKCAKLCGDRAGKLGGCAQGVECQMFSDIPLGFCPNVGSSQQGQPCPQGGVNAGADFCASGLECLGTNDLLGAPCTTDAGCTERPGLGSCVAQEDGSKTCGYSYCSGRATNNTCPSGYEVIQVNTGTRNEPFCAPVTPAGSQAEGQACSYLNVNGTAGNCAAGLECVGSPVITLLARTDLRQRPGLEDIDVSTPCSVDADCASLPGKPQCVALGRNGAEKRCGWSSCAAASGTNGCTGQAPAGFEYREFNSSETTKVCVLFPLGDKTLGQPCAFGLINREAGNCAATFSCVGLDPNGAPAEARVNCASNPNACSTGDAAAVFQPNGQCVDLNDRTGKFCGTSYCSKTCLSDAECTQEAPNGFGTGSRCQRPSGGGEGFCIRPQVAAP